MDKRNFRLTWTIGQKGSVVFEVPLDELSKPEGRVTARFPGGKTGAWQTVPVPQ